MEQNTTALDIQNFRSQLKGTVTPDLAGSFKEILLARWAHLSEMDAMTGRLLVSNILLIYLQTMIMVFEATETHSDSCS